MIDDKIKSLMEQVLFNENYEKDYTTKKIKHSTTEKHKIADEEKSSSAVEVYHKGELIGKIESYKGVKYGARIGNSVSSKKDKIEHQYTLNKGHFKGNSNQTDFSTQKSALISMMIAHQRVVSSQN
jgi:transcriptional regulator with PAS, ATPase and Fis domain